VLALEQTIEYFMKSNSPENLNVIDFNKIASAAAEGGHINILYEMIIMRK
jgi:hypothetical protein